MPCCKLLIRKILWVELTMSLPPALRDAAVIQAIVVLRPRLSLGAVAEGIGTSEQWSFLRSIDCDVMQEYFFSQPLAAETGTCLLQAG
jgi:EAL domain-containing protein (putative c-di-GMP-specific phosphodiesterase class I)